MCGGVRVSGSRIGLRNPGLTGVENSTESRRNHDLSVASARIAGVEMGGSEERVGREARRGDET